MRNSTLKWNFLTFKSHASWNEVIQIVFYRFLFRIQPLRVQNLLVSNDIEICVCNRKLAIKNLFSWTPTTFCTTYSEIKTYLYIEKKLQLRILFSPVRQKISELYSARNMKFCSLSNRLTLWNWFLYACMCFFVVSSYDKR